MTRKLKIWLEGGLQSGPLARIKSLFDVTETQDPALLRDCDAAVISSRPPCNGAWFDAAGPRLKIVARIGVGYDNVDVPAATARKIMVINTPEAPSESTAEHTIAMMMALCKRVVHGDHVVRGIKNDRSVLKGMELKDRTLGIIGLGRIGRRVAEMAGPGIRMNVIGFDPYAKPETLPYVKFVATLDELLAQSDVVSINAALTGETRNLFTEPMFRKMKRGAYFINCARGGAVDETALYKVLTDGHLAGAALDVFEPEPPPHNHPLLSLPNLIATPHIASFTDMGTDLMGNGVIDQLIQLQNSERPTHLLNPEVWPGRA